MQISNTLLVAIMFSTVVGLSIGSLLIALATLIIRGISLATSRLFLAWAIYLVLLHLSLFWETAAITRFDDWGFGGFLVVVFGPMLLLLSTQILTAEAGQKGLDQHYLEVSRRFHISFAALQGWLLLAGLLVAEEPTLVSARSAAMVLISLLCASIPGRVFQIRMCALAWVLALAVPVLET